GKDFSALRRLVWSSPRRCGRPHPICVIARLVFCRKSKPSNMKMRYHPLVRGSFTGPNHFALLRARRLSVTVLDLLPRCSGRPRLVIRGFGLGDQVIPTIRLLLSPSSSDYSAA